MSKGSLDFSEDLENRKNRPFKPNNEKKHNIKSKCLIFNNNSPNSETFKNYKDLKYKLIHRN